jgi:hypothetical protein
MHAIEVVSLQHIPSFLPRQSLIALILNNLAIRKRKLKKNFIQT